MGEPGTIWVVRAGAGGRLTSDFETKGLVAIGFHLKKDVTGMSRAHLTSELAEITGAKKEKVSGEAGSLYRFANKIRVDDIVITPDPESRELLFGRVASDYQFSPTPIVGSFWHFRKVNWLGRRSRDLLPKRVIYSLGSISTIFKPSGREQLLALLEQKEIHEGEHPSGSDDDVSVEEDLLPDLQSRSKELIRNRLALLDGYEMQDLVAGLLRAMGYHTRVSPPGADGGVDIVASRDPLGVDQPVKVQVKARPDTKSSASEVRALAGVLASGERGIFVSSGGFTKEATGDSAASRIAFIDGDRLQNLLVEYYPGLDQDARSLVPLRRLYFPVTP